MKGRFKYLLAINAMFFIYSLMGVLGKLAARESEKNLRFVVLYGNSLTVIGILLFGTLNDALSFIACCDLLNLCYS